MDDIAILEELILDLDLEYELVETVMRREGTLIINETIYDLDLSGLEIDYIPEEISRFEELRSLDLSFNNITEFSLALLDIPKLEKLYLYSNPFREVPLSLEPIFDLMEVEQFKLRLPVTQQTSGLPIGGRRKPKFRHYVRVDTEEEKNKVEILLTVYRERRCCKLTKRFEEKFCSLCGRMIPHELPI